MDSNNTIKQRVDDFYGFIAKNRLRLMDVAEHAELNYGSVKVNLRSYNVSAKRIDRLEKAAIELAERKLQQIGT